MRHLAGYGKVDHLGPLSTTGLLHPDSLFAEILEERHRQVQLNSQRVHDHS